MNARLQGVQGTGLCCRKVSRMACACSALPCSSSLRASCAHSSWLDRVAGALGGLAQLQPQQGEQRMLAVLLDQRQRLHRAGHRHVQRVDMELVELERLVRLVARAPIVEHVCLQIRLTHTVADIGISLALGRYKPEQEHVRILQTLGLVDREDQRRPERLSRSRLVFIAQHDHRMAHRLPGFGIEHGQGLVPRIEQPDLPRVG